MGSKDKSEMASRLTEERQHLGLTQAELSEKVGVSKVTISHYACGHYPPSADVLAKMDGLGADVRYILTGKRNTEPAVAASIDLNRLGLALDEANRQSTLNSENLSQKSLLERAWVIYQAWNAMMASSPATASKADDVTVFAGS